ncbi:hypothetical protein F4693_000144 [Sphingomonas endophytica]|uniref:Uncharacterized protein n=1 Tax=Sphingomonas endophytica TaxID=869719 RepID=A0A7X0MMP2_9SPHN|nr:hypothetical protein [Sphingomonas endophytica]MBB6503195.1 hypothetical protein [Sphingomonas endophytica]
MVGQPKTLYDVRKVHGSIRLACPACGTIKVHDLEELIRERSFQRRSLDWQAFLHDVWCWNCSPERTALKVGIIPFGGNDHELRVRRADTFVINLALTVLQDAACRASQHDPATPAVRLALRVLRPFLADRTLLVRFWEEAVSARKNPANETHFAHGWIVAELLRRGHSVWADFR